MGRAVILFPNFPNDKYTALLISKIKNIGTEGIVCVVNILVSTRNKFKIIHRNKKITDFLKQLLLILKIAKKSMDKINRITMVNPKIDVIVPEVISMSGAYTEHAVKRN